MTLYLKYRPRNLDELDIRDVGTSLKKIVLSGSIPHAFLFAGPKGTGKTSAARILAKIINCEDPGKDATPCDKCNQCKSITKGNNLDVIEMDAASHRGIDDVRALRDAVKLAPATAKKKIYIIDEAHMLTTEACNALLKTLEEPPEHVIFILATTNPEKLIDTIRSRTTLVAFRKATIPEIVQSLKRVVTGEKITITDELLEKIALFSSGAFRDAIKMLEQFSLEGEEFLNSFKTTEVEGFIGFLAGKDEKSAIEEIEKNVNLGGSVSAFTKSLLDSFHSALLSEAGMEGTKLKGLSKEDLVVLTDLFTEAYKNVSDAPIEQLPLEIAVVKWCSLSGGKSVSESREEKEVEDNEVADTGTGVSETADVAHVPADPQRVQEVEASLDITTMAVNGDIWKNILVAVRPVNASIEGLLRSSRPVSYDGKTLTLGVFYKFHKERLEDVRHRKLLEEVIAKVLNTPTRVVCILVEPPPKKIMEEAKTETVLTESKDTDIIKAAEEIFGN
jgi:DNA polymerase-3 subunit gamma/tau